MNSSCSIVKGDADVEPADVTNWVTTTVSPEGVNNPDRVIARAIGIDQASHGGGAWQRQCVTRFRHSWYQLIFRHHCCRPLSRRRSARTLLPVRNHLEPTNRAGAPK